MKFEEWYKNWNIRTSRYAASPDKKDVRSGWNACKREILETIEPWVDKIPDYILKKLKKL